MGDGDGRFKGCEQKRFWGMMGISRFLYFLGVILAIVLGCFRA